MWSYVNIIIGTHGIQNVTVDSPQPNEIRMRGDFIDQATATGVLLIVYSLSDESDVHYIAFDKRLKQDIDVNVTGLAGAEYYGVSVFALENGLPFDRVVTLPKLQYVNNTEQHNAHEFGNNILKVQKLSYKLHPTSTGICINCTILDNSTTDCVAVVHQRISQLSSSGLISIESSHKFNRSGDTAYGCIEGVSLTHYQVGVIGGLWETMSESQGMHTH